MGGEAHTKSLLSPPDWYKSLFHILSNGLPSDSELPGSRPQSAVQRAALDAGPSTEDIKDVPLSPFLPQASVLGNSMQFTLVHEHTHLWRLKDRMPSFSPTVI